MPSIENVQTALLGAVQEIRTAPDMPRNAPFLAGYWQATNDLTTLLSDMPVWTEDRLPADVLARVGAIRTRLRQAMEAPAPEHAMAAGASGTRA